MDDNYFDIGPYVAYVETRSWRGISLGASHTYGKITFAGREYDDPTRNNRLERKLDRSGAAEYNRMQREAGYAGEKRKPGDWTDSYPDAEAVYKYAVECFHKGEFPTDYGDKKIPFGDAIFLIAGDHCTAQPQRVLAARTNTGTAQELLDTMVKLNELFEAGGGEDGWDWDRQNRKELRRLSAEWFALLKEVIGKELTHRAE
jgi:hypothetical protein